MATYNITDINDIFSSERGLKASYAVVGPYGCGKTTLMKKEAMRIAQRVVETEVDTLLVLCVWKQDAVNLVAMYREFAKTLPFSVHLEVKVTLKEELLDSYKIKYDRGRTFEELGNIVYYWNRNDSREAYLLADDISVEYEALDRGKKPTPDELIGYIPFATGSALYPWLLDPERFHILAFLMPECRHLVPWPRAKAESIEEPPHAQGPVQVFVVDTNLRSTRQQHEFLAGLEAVLEDEDHVDDFGGCLLPPEMEKCGRDKDGQMPQWIPMPRHLHMLCQTGCEKCMVYIIKPSLDKTIREIDDRLEVSRSDITIVIMGELFMKDPPLSYAESYQREQEAKRINEQETRHDNELEVTQSNELETIERNELVTRERNELETRHYTRKIVKFWMEKQYPGVTIILEEELAGMEVPVLIALVNGSVKDQQICYTISRAYSHLYLYCEDYNGILEILSYEKKVARRDDLYSLDTSGFAPVSYTRNIAQFDEALPILINCSEIVTMENLVDLSKKWNAHDRLAEMLTKMREPPSRRQVLATLATQWKKENKDNASLFTLKLSLIDETVKLDHVVDKIENHLHQNLLAASGNMIEYIKKPYFNKAIYGKVAEVLGVSNRFAKLLLPPEEGSERARRMYLYSSDYERIDNEKELELVDHSSQLESCIHHWEKGMARDATSADLEQILQFAGFPIMAKQIHEEPEKVIEPDCHPNIGFREFVKRFGLDILVPCINVASFVVLIYHLFLLDMSFYGWTLTTLLWVPCVLFMLGYLLDSNWKDPGVGKVRLIIYMVLAPAADILALVEVFLRRNTQNKTVMEKRRWKMTIEAATAMRNCNLWTSYCIIILLLIWFNSGILKIEEEALGRYGIICGVVHLFNLLVATFRTSSSLCDTPQRMERIVMSLPIRYQMQMCRTGHYHQDGTPIAPRTSIIFDDIISFMLLFSPVAATSILRIIGPALILSRPGIHLIKFVFLPMLPVGMLMCIYIIHFIFHKMDRSLRRWPDMLDSLMSMLFPYPPRHGNDKVLSRLAMWQFLASNCFSLFAILLAGYSLDENPPSPSDLVSLNIFWSVRLTSIFLWIYITLMFPVIIWTIRREIPFKEENEDDENKPNESEEYVDVLKYPLDLEDETEPLIVPVAPGHDQVPSWLEIKFNQVTNFLVKGIELFKTVVNSIFKVIVVYHEAVAVVSCLLLFLTLSSFSLLILKVYNTCPTQYKDQHTNLTCDNTTSIPLHGTTCNVSCTAGYITAEISAFCLWSGRWSTHPTCEAPTILLAGSSLPPHIQSVFELFPAPANKSSVKPFPLSPKFAMAGFVNGVPLVCGGALGKNCYNLSREANWMLTPNQLLKEVRSASIAVYNSGRSFWILGGIDKHDIVQATTMIFQEEVWSWGPNMTTEKVGHCSCTLHDDIFVTGGHDNNSTLAKTQKFSLSSMRWSDLPAMNYPRIFHSCSIVWINDRGGVVSSPTKTSILTIVVAGGVTHLTLPKSTAEMFLQDQNKWIILSSLPNVQEARMSLPTALNWLPGYGLLLMGGCRNVSCTSKVWKLGKHKNGYEWVDTKPQLATALAPHNVAMRIPTNYFSSGSTSISNKHGFNGESVLPKGFTRTDDLPRNQSNYSNATLFQTRADVILGLYKRKSGG